MPERPMTICRRDLVRRLANAQVSTTFTQQRCIHSVRVATFPGYDDGNTCSDTFRRRRRRNKKNRSSSLWICVAARARVQRE